MEQKELNSGVANQIADLASMTLKISMQKMEESLQARKKEMEDQLEEFQKRSNDLWHKQPVLSVTLDGNQSAIQLTKRACASLPRLIVNAKIGLYSMLVGPAGCGKTTVAHQVAEALKLQFGAVCLTAGASETWLFGRQTPSGFIEGVFAKIYREGGVFLADEMDAADANLLLSINTALSHDSIINPMSGELLQKHKDFVFIGAANTNGKGASHIYTGRSRLDAATLDRMVIVQVDYDADLEQLLCPNKDLYNFLKNTRDSLKANGYDEFVSTRAFTATHSQLEAGIPSGEILKSLTANWGDAAKDIATKEFNRNFKGKGVDSKKKPYYENIEITIKKGTTVSGRQLVEELRKKISNSSDAEFEL